MPELVAGEDSLAKTEKVEVMPPDKVTPIEKTTEQENTEALSCNKVVSSDLPGDDFSLRVCLDLQRRDLVFKTEIAKDAWLGVGFGKGMKDIDMIVWLSEGETGTVKDLWSTGLFQPELDQSQDVTLDEEPTYDASTGRVSFVTRRKLDTGDSNDRVFELETEYDVSFAYRRGSRRRML